MKYIIQKIKLEKAATEKKEKAIINPKVKKENIIKIVKERKQKIWISKVKEEKKRKKRN